MGKVTVRKEFVRMKQADGSYKLFGPYRYDYWREKGKLKKRYMGKWVATDDLHESESIQEVSYADSLLKGYRVPDWYCCDLLGIVAGDSFSARRAKYRAGVRACCPHSGSYDERRYRLLRLAWDQIRGERR